MPDPEILIISFYGADGMLLRRSAHQFWPSPAGQPSFASVLCSASDEAGRALYRDPELMGLAKRCDIRPASAEDLAELGL